jgi:hypothetical protein
MEEALNESIPLMRADETYRRQGRHIIVAQIESLVPLHTTLDPAIWGGGNTSYTWKRVQTFYSRSPLARNSQLPMHYFAEYLEDDYVMYVGCPLTNKSWFLQQAVAAGVLPVQYMDAILVVIQENYSVENVERRLWRVLANNLITPMMRLFDITKERVVFFEDLANREAVNGPDWPFRWREPTFLDPLMLQLQIKDFMKT